jgi:hypothetical protein
MDLNNIMMGCIFLQLLYCLDQFEDDENDPNLLFRFPKQLVKCMLQDWEEDNNLT